MILPALFLSHVESMVQSKDKLYKRTNFVAASFTDDGLLLGVAYLLEVRPPRVATPTLRPRPRCHSTPSATHPRANWCQHSGFSP